MSATPDRWTLLRTTFGAAPHPQPRQQQDGEHRRQRGQQQRAPAFEAGQRPEQRGGDRSEAELALDRRDRHEQQAGEQAEDDARRRQRAHRDQHGDRRLLGGERMGGRRAHEGGVGELHHRGEGEQAADHRRDGERPMAGLERRIVDQPLRREAVERRHAGERQARQQEDAEGERHATAEPAKLVERGGVASQHHRAGDEEHRVLQHHVVDEVHQAAGDAERRAERHAEQHVAELAHRRVDQQQLDAVLDRRHRAGVEDGQRGDDRDDVENDRLAVDLAAELAEQRRAAEHDEELQHAPRAALQQHRRDVAGDWSRSERRVHLVVDAHRQHRRLHHQAEEHQHDARRDDCGWEARATPRRARRTRTFPPAPQSSPGRGT